MRSGRSGGSVLEFGLSPMLASQMRKVCSGDTTVLTRSAGVLTGAFVEQARRWLRGYGRHRSRHRARDLLDIGPREMRVHRQR